MKNLVNARLEGKLKLFIFSSIILISMREAKIDAF
jgi:hypothetical protein